MSVDAMKKFETQICLVSGQPDANLFPVIDKELRPKRVILLATPQMAEQAEMLKAAIQNYAKTDIVALEASDAYDMKCMDERLTSLEAEEGLNLEDAAVNITGGTKLMAIACFRWCLAYGVPCFYMSVEKSELTFFTAERDDMKTYGVKIDGSDRRFLQRYFQAHGYELQENKAPMKLTVERQECLDYLMSGNRENDVGRLNKIAADAAEAFDRKPWNRIAVQTDPSVTGSDFFTHFCPAFVGDREVVFSGDTKEETRESIRFLNGIWFEYAVASALKEAFPGAMIYQNVEVVDRDGKGSKNEFDVVLFYQNQLCVIEVKTKKFEERDNNAQDVIHKLGATVLKTGGIKARKCLISYRKVPGRMLARAKENDVFVIQGNDLFPHNSFIGKLKKWLS